MLNLVKKAQNIPKIAKHLPLIDILSDGKTICSKNFGLIQVIKIEGKDYNGLSSIEQTNLFSRRKRFFENLPEEVNISFYYLRKKITTSSLNKNKTIPTKSELSYVKIIDDLWQANFQESFKTEIYLSVRWQMNKDDFSSQQLNDVKYIKEIEAKLRNNTEKLDNEILGICKNLEEYNPAVINHNDDESDIIKFWNYLINHNDDHIFYPDYSLNETLALTNYSFDCFNGVIEMQNALTCKRKFCKIMILKNFPDETSSKALDFLLQSKRTFSVVQNVIPVDIEKNKRKIGKMMDIIKSFNGIGFLGVRYDDLNDAGEDLEAKEINFNQHYIAIAVYEDDLKELQKAIVEINALLISGGINCICETFNIENAFWSFFPDYAGVNAGRINMISSENTADFITLSSSNPGLTSCSFGDQPVTTFKTAANSSYNFTFHAGASKNENGHTFIFGAPGTGKTTMIAFLLANCLKYEDMKILAFDSQRGLKIPTISFGGDYIDFEKDRNFGLNPMLLPKNEANMSFLERWLTSLAGDTNEEEKKQIIQFINANYSFGKSKRRLANIEPFLGQALMENGQANLSMRLAKWFMSENDDIENLEFKKQIFNSEYDSLSFNKSMIAFDMGNILEDTELTSALSLYIFHTFHSYIADNPCPNVVFIDEMFKYINNPIFSNHILRLSKEVRKKNGILIGALQEATALTENKIGRDLITNAATFLIFPDPGASEDDYLLKKNSSKINLGLTDTEFEWVKTPPDAKKREVMMKRKRTGESVILDINMLPLGNYLKILSSDSDNVITLDSIRKAMGKDAEHHKIIQSYLQAVRK